MMTKAKKKKKKNTTEKHFLDPCMALMKVKKLPFLDILSCHNATSIIIFISVLKMIWIIYLNLYVKSCVNRIVPDPFTFFSKLLIDN